jgi:hypothetical protein
MSVRNNVATPSFQHFPTPPTDGDEEMRRPLERLQDFGTDAPARTGDPQIHNLGRAKSFQWPLQPQNGGKAND